MTNCEPMTDDEARLGLLLAQRHLLQEQIRPLSMEIERLREKTRTREARPGHSAAQDRKANIESLTSGRPIKSHDEWTGPELETIARRELTARQCAAMLGRSYFAVKNMRRKLKVSPREQRLADLGPGYQR